MKYVFQAGGALSPDHPSYVEREADHDALRAALAGEYLHVIAPRQVGKTSLLKRLAEHLAEMGWRSAHVDLSTLMDLRKPAWYAELGNALSGSFTPGLTPALTNQIDLRRYLLDQALPLPDCQPCLALLLDEVESAGKARDADGMPFSDTFFSMLRELYNQRDKLDGVLVVALAGAVNPDDLVRDPDISPFNVGQEISVDDFTPTETQMLTGGLAGLGVSVDEAVHKAIYDWTNGHPYLTQRICAELERAARNADLTSVSPVRVEYVVEQVILNPANPLQRDNNIRHVTKMLSSLSPPAAGIWSQLRTGGSISSRQASGDLFLELYLSGAVKDEAGWLVMRNRIYALAFGGRHQAEPRPLREKAALGSMVRRGAASARSPRIFISSSWEDLQSEREAVEKALHRMRDSTFAGIEYFGSRSDTPRQVSLSEVERSDVYIGIFADRYGSGITEAEYHRARERGIPCLIYFKDDRVPAPPACIERDPVKVAKLEALKRELKAHHTVSTFRNPDHLATQAVADLHSLLGSAPLARGGTFMQAGSDTWTTEQKVLIVLDYRRTGSARCPLDGATLRVFDVGAGSDPHAIMVDCPICQNTFVSDEVKDLVKARAAQPKDTLPLFNLRLQDLADNVRQDLALLKEYEDALRYEDDPRRKAKYRRETEQLRGSASRYQQEYEELRTQVVGEPPEAMREAAAQLRQMDAKLDVLLASQNAMQEDLASLRQEVLSCFDVSEQTVIAAVVERLDQSQLATVRAVVEATEAGRFAEQESQETLLAVQDLLAEARQKGVALVDSALGGSVQHLSEVFESPGLEAKHKLKVTAPIIPFILSYEGEIALGSRLNLKRAWQRLVAKVRGER